MFRKRITKVVVLTLVLIFSFSSIAFSSDNVFHRIVSNVMPKVFVNDVEVPFINHNDKIYVPIDSFTIAGATISNGSEGITVTTEHLDVDTAYGELKSMYDRHIERIKNPPATNMDKALKQNDERIGILLNEIARLDNVDFTIDDDIGRKLFFTKTFLHSALNNELLVYIETMAGLNGDKEAKNRLKDIRSATVVYGGYVSGTLNTLEEALKEAK